MSRTRKSNHPMAEYRAHTKNDAWDISNRLRNNKKRERISMEKMETEMNGESILTWRDRGETCWSWSEEMGRHLSDGEQANFLSNVIVEGVGRVKCVVEWGSCHCAAMTQREYSAANNRNIAIAWRDAIKELTDKEVLLGDAAGLLQSKFLRAWQKSGGLIYSIDYYHNGGQK